MAEDQKLRGLKRFVEIVTDQLVATVNSLLEWETISGVSAGAGAAPSASTDDGDDLTVLEPYGFASNPPGTAQAVALAVGADDENRVALGVSSVSGRPATDPGDSVQWTSAGHSLLMDDDGGVTMTAKDGSTIVLDAAGAITVTAGTAASITINVDGGQSVNIGGSPAFALVKDAENSAAINAGWAAGAAFIGTPGDPLGTNAGLAFAAAAAAYGASPSAATLKAKGV